LGTEGRREKRKLEAKMTTIRKRTAILAGALLMLGATAPVCAHAQSDQQQQQQQDKKHPPAKREQQPQQKPPRQQERTQQRDQQRQQQQAQKQQEQQQKQQRQMEKQQAKQQQQEQKRVQKEQQKQQRAQQRQQEQQRRNYQQPQRGQEQQGAQGRPQGRGNRGDPQQIAHYEQAHMRQYRPHGHEREVRIPDPQYHQYFGEEHRFHIGEREDVDGFPRFQYESFWFVLEEPWPEYWYDTDDFYVVYTDGGYFLYDYDDPGVMVQLVVVTDED
jgi:hypothetical protein